MHSEKKLSPRDLKRLEGAKQAVSNEKITQAIHRGAAGIEGLVEESGKRNDIVKSMRSVEERNSRMSLFAMQGTDPVDLQRFLQFKQDKILRDMESEQKSEGKKRQGTVLGKVHLLRLVS